MAHKPSYEELIHKLAEQDEIIQALRNQEVDAVIGTENVLMLRLKAAEDELRQQHSTLEREVEERTRELRDLSHVLFDAQEEQREIIGNELYDNVSQLLTYVLLLIDGASRKPDEKSLIEAGAVVKAALEKIGKLSPLLSPRLIHNLGLLKALEYLVAEYTMSTNIKVEFDPSDELGEVQGKVALVIYRIAQESLSNIARHAKASEVQVRLRSQAGKLRLEITDNGIGFNPKKVYHSTGLTGMKERALALGGRFTLSSNLEQGTRVSVELPLFEMD